MSIIADLFGGGRIRSEKGPTDDFWYNPVSMAAGAGMVVTPDSAARLTAVMACVGLIAETTAAIPLHVYRRRSDGGKDRALDHPLYQILHDQPNEWQTAFEFIEMMTGHLALRGNAYAQIVPGPRGAVDQLIPLHPDRMQVKRLPSGRLVYLARMEDGRQRPFTQDEVLHLRLRSNDGIYGLSPISEARESIGLAMAAEQHGATFFKNFGSPPGAITTQQDLTEEQIDLMRQKWRENQAGKNANNILILSNGLTWGALGVNNKDSQFLETRQYQTVDIARIFRVPPHMIGETTKSTSWGSGIEQLSIGFVTFTLQPWLTRWTTAIRRDLITAKDTYFAEFDTAALLRGDRKARMDSYRIEREMGTISVNEIRVAESRNKIEGGDDYTPLAAVRVTGGPGAAEETPPDDDEDGDAAEQVMVRNIAERIASAEQRALDRAPKTDRTWAAWATGFMSKQVEHSTRALEPLAKLPRWTGLRAETMARAILADAEPSIRPGMDATGWAERRVDEIMARIMEVRRG